MNTIISLFLTFLPIYLICLFVYNKDNKKEPKKFLRKLFIFGILSCIPAAIIELIIEPLFGDINKLNLFYLFIYVALGIALVEELCKWIIVYKKAYNHKEFDQTYDAIVYSVFVSLGFACLENILYCFSSNNILTSLLRALTAIPGHTMDAIVMGNFLYLAKVSSLNNDKKQSKHMLFLSIFMPTLTHTIYDYCIFTNRIVFYIIFALFLLFIYIYSIDKIKQLSKNNSDLNIKNDL